MIENHLVYRQTDRPTYWPTDISKTICPLFFERGHKKDIRIEKKANEHVHSLSLFIDRLIWFTILTWMLVYKAIYSLYLPLVYKDELLSVGDEVFPERGVPHGVAVLELKLDTSLYGLRRIRHGVHHLSIICV